MTSLSNQQIENIINRLNQFCDDNPTISNSVIAKNIGTSSSYVSQFRNGKYPVKATLPNFASKVENYLNNAEADPLPHEGGLKFAMTVAANDIFKTIDYALSIAKTGTVTGMPGCGKTIALKEYVKRNPTAIMVEVTPLVSPRILLADICDKLNIPNNHVRNVMFTQIVNKLQGTKRLLLIDEGENLTLPCLEVIRRIQDFAGIGMILAGTSKLLDRLRGPRKELQQLYSRIGIKTEVNKLQAGDVRAILKVNFPEAVNFTDTFLTVSKQNGRLLEHLVALVKKTIEGTGEELTDDLIDDAAGMLLV